ncbi:MAG: hypothetical protein AB1665_04865, partial [Candidatus Thermoplasmatota archaeon]
MRMVGIQQIYQPLPKRPRGYRGRGDAEVSLHATRFRQKVKFMISQCFFDVEDVGKLLWIGRGKKTLNS